MPGIVVVCVCAVLSGSAPIEDAAPTDKAVRLAAVRALALIESSTKVYPEHRTCFTCHNQAVPMLALAKAKGRGFSVDADNLKAIAQLTADDLESALEEYKAAKGQPGGVTRAGYALLALAEQGWKPDETTDAVSFFLVDRDKDKGRWRESSRRPPSEASEFTATYLALRGLANFGKSQPADKVAARVADARKWLEATEPKDAEDRVFRILGLIAAGGDAAKVKETAEKLAKAQRPDGGWAQLDDAKESDAYAAGTVLSALHAAGTLKPTDPAYRRGLAYLIKTQKPDGSWHVVSRSKPFQPYFESGFPHGKDQFISIAASAWAAHALVLAVPEKGK